MYKIGLIAPEWSLERVLSVAREYRNEIEVVPFQFEKLDDIPGILDSNRNMIGKWLFSGPIPFYVAKRHLKTDDDLFYCRITEAGLLNSLLEVMYHYSSFHESMALDFIEEAADIDEIMNEIDIPTDRIKILKYSVPVDEKELFQLHYDLWKSGKTRCSLTTIPSVYENLKKAGVPVFIIRSSKMEIRITFELLIEKCRSLFFKNAQLGILIIELCNYENIVAGVKTPYQLQFLELSVNNALLTYSEKISGYLVHKGNGRYEIFGSRGNIEKNIKFLQSEMERISLELNVPLIAGAGFGETVFLAQINANKALHHARKKKGLVIFTGDGEIVEHSADKEELMYSYYTHDKKLDELLRKSQVGIRTYKKMLAVSSRFGSNPFTASALAIQMGVTDRNVRRIISGLLKSGLLMSAGEESSGVSGRPAKLYRFSDQNTGK